MLKITKQNNSIVVEGVNNYKYPDNAVLSFPLNSIICEVDESDIITFHSASNYDVVFSGNVDEITINGESVTKENVGELFGAISNTSGGGGGGLTPEQEEKLNNAVQIADYNADKEAQATIDERQNAAIEGLGGDIEGKQDKIEDLDAIREGAEKGATALQEETDPIWNAEKVDYYKTVEVDVLVGEAKASANTAISIASSAEGIATAAHSRADEALEELEKKADKSEIPSLDGYATESWVEGKGYLTEHQDISGKLDKTEAAETYQPKGNYATKDEIPSLDGYATEEWVEGKGYLTEHQDISGKLDKSEAEETYQPKGDYALKNDLEGYVGVETYNQHITDQTAVDEAQNSAIEGIEGDITRIDSKIDDIELFKFPNATIIGEPTVQSGQVSNFSTENYLQFPFVLDLHNQSFQIDFCFTTSTDVSGQQNVLDSKFGIALAIKDGKGLMAISSNGTSWNIGSVTGTMNIEPNTTYYARLTWDGIQYKTMLSTDGTAYTQDMVLVGAQRPFPTTIFIGGCDLSETGHTAHPFKGIINMNKAQLTVMGNVIWQGMDDAGLATRLATNLNNIDEVGKERIKEIVGTIPTKTSELTNDSGFLTEHQSLAEYAKTADVEANYQPKGDYLTEETDPVWQSEKGNYYTKDETDGLVGDVKSTAETAYNLAQDASNAASTAESKADEALTTLEGKADKSEIPSLDGYATEQWVGEQGYLTEHQSLKTINGETIVGDGDIIIESGGDIYGVHMMANYNTNKFALAVQKNGEYINNANVNAMIFDGSGSLSTVTISKSGIWYIFDYWSTYVAAQINISVGGKDIYGTVVPLYTNLQKKLTSGTNIKTINGESILGSGNIEIQGGITEETDPTVPAHVKAITEADIAKWNQGGGGEPYEYIKSAEKSTDGNTLTLTKKDGSEVVFSPSTGGGGDGKTEIVSLNNYRPVNVFDGGWIQIENGTVLQNRFGIGSMTSRRNPKIQIDNDTMWSVNVAFRTPSELGVSEQVLVDIISTDTTTHKWRLHIGIQNEGRLRFLLVENDGNTLMDFEGMMPDIEPDTNYILTMYTGYPYSFSYITFYAKLYNQKTGHNSEVLNSSYGHNIIIPSNSAKIQFGQNASGRGDTFQGLLDASQCSMYIGNKPLFRTVDKFVGQIDWNDTITLEGTLEDGSTKKFILIGIEG